MNESREVALEGAPQRSVTDWLMQVIAGKKPIGTPFGGLAENAALLEAAGATLETRVDGVAAPVAAPVAAEDLYRTPRFPILLRKDAVSDREAPASEETTAADVCRVPMPQPDEPVLTASALLREPAPYVTELEARLSDSTVDEEAVTAADISRQWVIDALERAVERERAAEAVPEPVAAIVTEPEAAPVVEAADAALEMEAVLVVEAAEEPATAAEMVSPAAPEAELLAAFEARTEETAQPEEIQSGEEPTVEESAAGETGTETADEIAAAVEAVSAEAETEIVAAAGVPAEPKGAGVWAREDFWETAALDAGEREIHAALAREARAKTEPASRKTSREREANHGSLRGTYLGAYLEPEDLGEIDKAKPAGWSSAWRTLLRLGSAVPWLARALPLLEPGMGAQQGSAMSQEVRQDVAGLRLVQYEIRTAVQDHSAQLKRMEEQLARVRESVESKSNENADLAEQVRSAIKLLRMVGIGIGILLATLIALAAVMVAHR